MVEIYRNLLVIICAGLLIWGFIRIERIYQYPFFMGAIFMSFLVPQAFALVDNPGSLSQESLEQVLLISSLCAVACWIGYQGKPNLKWLTRLQVDIDKNKLFQSGLFLTFIGLFFNYLIDKEIQSQGVGFSNNRVWTGSITIYSFFAQVIYIAFAIFLLEVLKKPSIQNIIFTLLAGWFPLQTLFSGRRQPTMTFIIIIGFCLWTIKRYIPPRWLIISAIFLMTILVPVIGAMREKFWEALFSGQWQSILLTTQKALNTQQSGDILELRNAAFLISATAQTNSYGLGGGWWDSIIFSFIPAQILGNGFKQSLQFNLSGGDIYQLYGYSIPSGSTNTGVADSFMEFGYLGFLFFALVGYLFKHLWVSAYYQKSLFATLVYIGLVSPAMVSLTHGTGRFIIEAIFQIGVISSVFYYAKKDFAVISIN